MKEPWQNSVSDEESLLSSLGHGLLMSFLFIMATPGVIILIAIIVGYFVWAMMFWVYERIMTLPPIKATISNMTEVLVFFRDSAPMVLLLGMTGGFIGMCGGGPAVVTGCCLGAALAIFIQMIRQLEYQPIPPTDVPPRERREWGWGDDEGYWYGGNQAYHTPAPIVKHVAWDNSSRVKKTVYRNPWVWQGFQAREGPKEDDIRMDL